MSAKGAVAAALVTMACTALVAGGARADNGSPGDFYTPPADIAAEPGTVLRTEDFVPAVDPLGLAGAATARRLMYVSRDDTDRPTAVTGAVYVPRAPWPGPGPRPLVSLAAAAHGIGPQCVQSMAFDHPIAVSLTPSLDASIGFEVESTKMLLDKGYAVAVTDYQRAGGVQAYLDRVAGGRAVLDIARAVQRIPGIEVGPIAVWGYSQGGGAAAAAAEIQPSYAPELPLRAAYAGAVAANPLVFLRRAGAAAGFAVWAAAAASALDPQVRQAIDDVVNPEGAAVIRQVGAECFGGLVAARESHNLTKSGRPLLDEMVANPVIDAWLDRQQLGTVAPQVPMEVHGGLNDDLVPYQSLVGLAEQWRALGADVTVLTNDAPPILPGTAVNHSLPHLTDFRPLQWLATQLGQ
ncbi:lipase family protein [Nocardia sp. CA-129566]|uniref:lipase family protein n=1 Tax=Nocardia sp. CA-129566 TaxID=3239976 RepID=UPI003D96067E